MAIRDLLRGAVFSGAQPADDEIEELQQLRLSDAAIGEVVGFAKALAERARTDNNRGRLRQTCDLLAHAVVEEHSTDEPDREFNDDAAAATAQRVTDRRSHARVQDTGSGFRLNLNNLGVEDGPELDPNRPGPRW